MFYQFINVLTKSSADLSFVTPCQLRPESSKVCFVIYRVRKRGDNQCDVVAMTGSNAGNTDQMIQEGFAGRTKPATTQFHHVVIGSGDLLYLAGSKSLIVKLPRPTGILKMGTPKGN